MDLGAPSPRTGSDPVFVDLWNRLARPFDVVAVASALVGLPPVATAQFIGVALARSDEAQALLTAMPGTVRSLATSIRAQHERCVGELRGPVLWSETMSARASSFGDRDLFICATTRRAYDGEENRVLVAALKAVVDGARDATERMTAPAGDPLLDDARRAGADAARWLDHPSLIGVSRHRPDARAVRRTRSGKHRATYEPALAMLRRAHDPLGPDDIAHWRDQRTRAQHHVLMGLVRRLEQDGRELPAFRVERGAVLAGPLQFHHNRRLGDRDTVSGITIGRLLVDVPLRLHDPDRLRAERELADRSGGRPTRAILEESDIDAAVDQAIELAMTRRSD